MQIQITKTTCPKEHTPADQLGFGRIFSDHMFLMEAHNGVWGDKRIVPFGPICLHPAATVLHYGQEIFEGLKAYKSADGRVLLFRAKDNFARMNEGAKRLCMPEIDVDEVYEALRELLLIEKDWIPNKPGTSLYIRPNLFGIDDKLGVSSANHVMLNIICSPSGTYYANGVAPTRIMIEDQFVRAVRGGVGFAKTGGNYASSMLSGEIAKKNGCDQVLWLDGIERKYIEEVGAMNIFFLIGEKLVTPELQGSILSGITRRSIITLAKETFGVEVEERKISIDEIIEKGRSGELKECFGSGTAAVVSPVGELIYQNQTLQVGNGGIGALTQKLYDQLTGIQYGSIPDEFGWVSQI